ncbi:hypothetical protein CJ030_MR4G016477 [Morella rubra]|uniref:Uncharacterized protein n=1 Tax=Morella rubra TaxID=262757 RepID=A0A6A1VRX9_9ROSI|nr:hypothetical protein CJ030_MR4G016477 [Morella rubra]
MARNGKAVKVLVSLSAICAFTCVFSVLSERLDSCAVAAAIVLPVALVLLPQMDTSLDLSRRKNLNPQFLQILRDVLRGIGYLHQVENRCHGNLSELNIVIVNGRGKITGMVKDVSKKYVDDYLSLATLLEVAFVGTQTIPTELELLLTYISTTEPSR